jgi:hypothetical protein
MRDTELYRQEIDHLRFGVIIIPLLSRRENISNPINDGVANKCHSSHGVVLRYRDSGDVLLKGKLSSLVRSHGKICYVHKWQHRNGIE